MLSLTPLNGIIEKKEVTMENNPSYNGFYIITNGAKPTQVVDGVQYITTDKPLQENELQKIIGSERLSLMPISQSKCPNKTTIPNIIRYDYNVIGYVAVCREVFKKNNSIMRFSKKTRNKMRMDMFSAVLNSHF